MNWQPIETAPTSRQILLGKWGHSKWDWVASAVLRGETVCLDVEEDCLSGKSSATHWQEIEPLMEATE